MTRSRFFHFLMGLLTVGVLVLLVAYGYVQRVSDEPGRHGDTFYLYIAPGDNLTTVADYAEVSGLVSDAWQMKLIAYVHGYQRSIFAGEYDIIPGQTPLQTLQKIANQDTYKRRLVVPEGTSGRQLTMLLSESFGINMSGYASPPEGSVLPETYFYERGHKATSVVKRMQQAQRAAIDKLWPKRMPGLPYDSIEEAVTLASIVEKETAVEAERRLVAAVFVNRLRLGMRLQSDPTVVYGITAGIPLGRAITRADLRADTPYNSYRRDGLPPTPITNPGLASLSAVLAPADVPYLYFVADGTGGHAFASTLEEHNRNVARWRELEKQR